MKEMYSYDKGKISRTSTGTKYVNAFMIGWLALALASEQTIAVIQVVALAIGLTSKMSACSACTATLVGGLATALGYYMGAKRLESEFDEKRSALLWEWKCQPDRVLPVRLVRESKRWALANAFAAGMIGSALFSETPVYR